MNNLSKFSQRGQVLPLTLVLLPMVLAVVFYMFNSGQLVQEKIGLTNTADAVAYSAGVYEARVLNYDAYANRAMVANEIAIAQAVGLASWTRYASMAAVNLPTSPPVLGWPTPAPPVSYLAMIPWANPATLIPALQQVRLNQVAILQMLADAVKAHDQAIKSLKAAQAAVHGAGNATALANRKAVIDQVATLNDPTVTANILPGSDDFAAFTQYYGLTKRQRMLEAVLNSREEFLRDPDPALDIQGRNWEAGDRPECPANLDPNLEKSGSTEIIGNEIGGNTMGYNRWLSKDELIYYYPVITPILDGDGNIIGYDCYINSKVVATGSANSLSTTLPVVEQGAIPEFYDLSVSALTSYDPKTQLAIRVTKPEDSQQYSGGTSAVKPAGSLALYNGNHAGAVSAAVAKVEVFFERPDDFTLTGGAKQRGSLFSPYWQVHLVPIVDTERAQAWLLQGF